jgi:hypothetical protein
VAYTFVLGGAPHGAPGQPRYRLGVYASVNNLTNRVNFGGFSGVITSPFFMQPTLASNPRKFDFGMNLSF